MAGVACCRSLITLTSPSWPSPRPALLGSSCIGALKDPFWLRLNRLVHSGPCYHLGLTFGFAFLITLSHFSCACFPGSGCIHALIVPFLYRLNRVRLKCIGADFKIQTFSHVELFPRLCSSHSNCVAVLIIFCIGCFLIFASDDLTVFTLPSSFASMSILALSPLRPFLALSCPYFFRSSIVHG